MAEEVRPNQDVVGREESDQGGMGSLGRVAGGRERREGEDREDGKGSPWRSHHLVGEVVEDIYGLLGRLPALPVAKDEVDPLVKVLADVFALEGLPHDPHKLVCAAVRPWREENVPKHLAVLPSPKIEAARVEEDFRAEVELPLQGRGDVVKSPAEIQGHPMRVARSALPGALLRTESVASGRGAEGGGSGHREEGVDGCSLQVRGEGPCFRRMGKGRAGEVVRWLMPSMGTQRGRVERPLGQCTSRFPHLGDKLLGVGGVVAEVLPGLGDAVEHPVSMVEAPALQLPRQHRHGLEA